MHREIFGQLDTDRALYFEQPELGRASFGMGRECMLEWGTQFVARLAPGAPREPLPDTPPSREAVQQRVDEAVRNLLHLFVWSGVGEIDQQPSAVSAIKVDGRRAYDRVRAGARGERRIAGCAGGALEFGRDERGHQSSHRFARDR